MSERDSITIDEIEFSLTEPTELHFDDLHTWIIWQFPRMKDSWLCGAVHPPIPSHGWVPATVKPKEKKVRVYAHLEKLCDSPEEASEAPT